MVVLENEIFVDAKVNGEWIDVGVINDAQLQYTKYDCTILGASGIENSIKVLGIEENTPLRLWKIIQQNNKAWKSYNEFSLWALSISGDVIFRDIKNHRKTYKEYI